MMNKNYKNNGFAAEGFGKLAVTCSTALAVIGLTTAVTIGAAMMSTPAHAADNHNEIILEKIENGEPLDFSEIVDDIEYNFTVFNEDGEEVPVILLNNGVVIDNNGYGVETDKAASYKLHDGTIVYMYNPLYTTFEEWSQEEPISEKDFIDQRVGRTFMYDQYGEPVDLTLMMDGSRVDEEGYAIKGIADGACRMHSGKLLYDFDPTKMSLDEWMMGTEDSEEEQVIAPKNQPITVEETDFTTKASFDAEDINWEEQTLTFDMYQNALYDMVDMSKMERGSVVEVDGVNITVETIDESDATRIAEDGSEEKIAVLTINKGMGSETVFKANEGGTWICVGPDDMIYDVKVGEGTYPISDQCVLTDVGASPSEKVEVAFNDLQSYLTENKAAMGNHFTSLDTSIEVADGKIVSIERVYRP